MIKIRFIHLRDAMATRAIRSPNGYMDEERRPGSDPAFNSYESSMFLNDLVRNRETEPASFIFTGEKRIKNMLEVFIRNANSIILNFNLDEFGRRLCPVLGHSAAQEGDRPGSFHRLNGV